MRSIQAAHFGRKALLPGKLWAIPGWLGGLVPMLRDYAAAALMFLQNDRPGKLLDVGCGTGDFLFDMRDAGWDVYGLEPYQKAANIARKRGIPVLGDTIEKSDLAASSLDAITSRHVIEHVDDPALFFRKSLNALKPGGKLVVLTPNTESRGHLLFKGAWIHLDPPRHFHLFSIGAIRRAAVAAGFDVVSSRTITYGSIFAYLYSTQLQQCCQGWRTLCKDGRFAGEELLRARLFWLREEAMRTIFPGAGEEILLIARKPLAGSEAREAIAS